MFEFIKQFRARKRLLLYIRSNGVNREANRLVKQEQGINLVHDYNPLDEYIILTFLRQLWSYCRHFKVDGNIQLPGLGVYSLVFLYKSLNEVNCEVWIRIRWLIHL